jgi:5-methylcytosine-specific restriction endonuclease McrA
VRFRLRSLEKKRCVRIRGRNLEGHAIEVFLPEEILRAGRGTARAAETVDTRDARVREAVLRREAGRCFYCLREVGSDAALDHVVAVSVGGEDTMENLVAACPDCNVAKGNRAAKDFLQQLYRRNRLTSAELDERLAALKALGKTGVRG